MKVWYPSIRVQGCEGALRGVPVLQLPCSVSVSRFTALSCAGCESVPTLAPVYSCTGNRCFSIPPY